MSAYIWKNDAPSVSTLLDYGSFCAQVTYSNIVPQVPDDRIIIDFPVTVLYTTEYYFWHKFIMKLQIIDVKDGNCPLLVAQWLFFCFVLFFFPFLFSLFFFLIHLSPKILIAFLKFQKWYWNTIVGGKFHGLFPIIKKSLLILYFGGTVYLYAR